MIILVTLIMLLSVIPMAFLGSNKQVPVPDLKNNSLVLTGDGVFQAKVIKLNNYLSFVGLSYSNEDKLIRQMINKINYVNCTVNSADCKVKVGLNPYGAGYRDEVIIRLKNESDANYVGFRLSYRLNYLLDTSPSYLTSYALVPSSVFLTGSTKIGNLTVVAKNISSLAYVSYTNNKDSVIKVKCDKVTYSKQGILMKAPSCIDTPQNYGNKFGLDYFTIIKNTKQFNKTLDLNLSFSSAYFKALGNFTNSNISDELNFADVSLSPDNQSIEVVTKNISKVNEIKQKLSAYNITREEKTAFVQFPSSIELENKTYEVLTTNGKIALNFPINQPEGSQKVKLRINVLFDEVVKIQAPTKE